MFIVEKKRSLSGELMKREERFTRLSFFFENLIETGKIYLQFYRQIDCQIAFYLCIDNNKEAFSHNLTL